MKNVLILGAGGQVAGHVIESLSKDSSLHLKLYLRDAARLQHLASTSIDLIEGDILDTAKLAQAVAGQDIVYVNINGQEDILTEHIIGALTQAGVQRLIFISAIGVYGEVTGDFGIWNYKMIGPILERYKKAVDLIESSGLKYTILRPSWYTDKDEVDYVLTQKGEPITRTEISRKSVADFVARVIREPEIHVNESVGLEKPGTEGDKPAWH